MAKTGYLRQQSKVTYALSSILRNVWRLLYLGAAAMFAYFTYVQFNDSDAAFWIVAYGIPTILAIVALAKTPSPQLLFALLVLNFINFCLYAPFAASGSWVQIEEGREALGTVIIMGFLVLAIFMPPVPVSLKKRTSKLGVFAQRKFIGIGAKS